MSDPSMGVRAIQRLRELLLEERSRCVPVKVLRYDNTCLEIGFENKEVLDKILDDASTNEMYELCLTYRKRPNNNKS